MAIVKMVGSLGIATLIGLSAPLAQAAFVATLEQVGNSVVATGSGTLNVDSLFVTAMFLDLPSMEASSAILILGATNNDIAWVGGITGPGTFGPGGIVLATSGVGDIVAIAGSFPSGPHLVLPVGYVSGSNLLDSATFANENFSTLGVDPGSYTWTWGSATPNVDSFTLDIGVAAPPPPPVDEPSALFDMGIGLATLVLAAILRRRAAA
jgi:hypothetical protein